MPILDRLDEQPQEDFRTVDLSRPVQQTSQRRNTDDEEPLPKFGQADCFKLIFTCIIICFCCAIGIAIVISIFVLTLMPGGFSLYYLQSCSVNALNIDSCSTRTCATTLLIDSTAFNISGLYQEPFEGSLNQGGFNFTVFLQPAFNNVVFLYKVIYNSTNGVNIVGTSKVMTGAGQTEVYYEFRDGNPGPIDPKGTLLYYKYFRICGIN